MKAPGPSTERTVALGQHGRGKSGTGGSFLTLETAEGPKPLLIAGGPGYGKRKDLSAGQLGQAGSGNRILGSSGVQKFRSKDVQNFNCAGAGFVTGPQVETSDLKNCFVPRSYSEGLYGGLNRATLSGSQGGFGGGASSIDDSTYGAGGGYTGGAHYDDGKVLSGGGAGSFASVPNAVFTHHQQTDGKCKIELLPDKSE